MPGKEMLFPLWQKNNNPGRWVAAELEEKLC